MLIFNKLDKNYLTNQKPRITKEKTLANLYIEQTAFTRIMEGTPKHIPNYFFFLDKINLPQVTCVFNF